jgi:cytochrome c biogenesis protein
LKKANILWSFFSSIKLTLGLLFLMVVLFIVATIIPSRHVVPELAWLGDVYHSRIFYALMGLFSLNLIICSINRLPLAVRQYRASYFPPPSGIFERLPQNRTIWTGKKIEDIERTVASSLSSVITKVAKMDAENGRLFYREKGCFSLFGVYIVHLGVLIIIAAYVIGSIFGFQADINLAEGEESDIVYLSKGKGMHPLGFSVRCDKFAVEFYDTGEPKMYRSDLSFIRDGQVVYQKSVLVNHPVSFDGIRFYQSSYGLSEGGKAVLFFTRDGVESPILRVGEGETFDLSGQQATATVLRLEEDMMHMGPAVKLQIETKKESIQFWVFQYIKEIAEVNPGLFSAVPLFNPGLFKPFSFHLQGIKKQYYTGLHVVHDPGVPFVLAGGIMLLAGIIVIFFIAYQRVWIRVEQVPEGVKISVAGRSSRYDETWQRHLDDLRDRIEKELMA